METIGSRVRLARQRIGMDRTELAARSGVGYSTISELERGGMKSTTKLWRISEALGVSMLWLETGKGSMHDAPGPVSRVTENETGGDYVRIHQIDGEADMGDGRINDDYPEVIRSIDLTPAFVRSVVGFVPPPGRLVLVTGRGDSMVPVIQPGESLIVDTGISAFDGDGIYLINSGNGQQIKALQDRGDAVYVVSANSLYPAFPLPPNTIVGGKVYLRNRIERLS